MVDQQRPMLQSEPAFQKLQRFYEANGKRLNMQQMFNEDPERFGRFSKVLKCEKGDEILVDYSKNLINNEVMSLLLDLSRARKVEEYRNAMFEGQPINFTENRAVLHIALRNRSNSPIYVKGFNVMPAVNNVLNQMRKFSDRVRCGTWKGYSGKVIKDIVNIGIGGSHLGPHMVCEALQAYGNGPRIHFVSCIGGTQLDETLKQLDTETTLFIIVSKSFTTDETMKNYLHAKMWFLSKAERESATAKHFVAVTSNKSKAEAYGFDEENIFEFWDWVGGPFSLWSAKGLSIACYIGMEHFEQLLAGAQFMDEHFRTAPLEENVPVILAMIGIWYSNFYMAESYALLPYDQRLHRFISYVQQGEMESNGKYITSGGKEVNYSTGPIAWGETGTNAQHAVFQLIHQGSRLVPCDLLASVNTSSCLPKGSHHKTLLANLVVQTGALVEGKSEEDGKKEVIDQKRNDCEKHKVCKGNKPCNVILLSKLTPYTLGSLLAIYEHKIFIQGAIWDINSFDSMGVAMCKQLAKDVETGLIDPFGDNCTSTKGLVDFIKCNHNK